MVDPPDSEQIARSLRQPEAFGVLFDRHGAALLRYLARRVGHEAGASLLGELFRIAFEKRTGFDGSRSSALPWLYGIGANLLMHEARSAARRSRRARAVEDHELVVAQPGSGAGVEDALVAELDARLLLPRVAAAIALLPEGEREALLLHVWEGLPYRDVAEALDTPAGTVRSRIHRARRRLRERIGAAGKEPEDTTGAADGREQ